MVKVTARKNEPLNSLIRRFNKKVGSAGVLKIARKKRYFVSKAEELRLAKSAAIRKRKREESGNERQK